VSESASSDSPLQLAIDVNELTFSYSKTQSPVLAIMQWQVHKNEHVFLSGPSGSGKSTLLNLLSGTLEPSSGSIALLDEPFSTLSQRQRDRFRSRHIGVVFQQFNLIPYLTVEQNIKAAAYFAKSKEDATSLRQRIAHLLAQLKLPGTILHTKADALSIGQQQRVAIARALINSPQILIVDEPTSALDVAARDSFMSLLKDVAKDSTLIFVSHDPAMATYFDKHIDIYALLDKPCSSPQTELQGEMPC